MTQALHITNGDCAAEVLAKAAIDGDILAWRDLIYEGCRKPGWPDASTLDSRASFLERVTGGGISRETIRADLCRSYQQLESAPDYSQICLWFDACLHDQSVLVHILSCLHHLGVQQADLICIDHFLGIEPFDGLGQLSPQQLASCYPQRQPVSAEQFAFAIEVDRALAHQDPADLMRLAGTDQAPLRWIPAAIERWRLEQPDPITGLGRLQQLALDSVHHGCHTPAEIFKAVAANDTHPQYWGDTRLWDQINQLADQQPARVSIEGPATRLPLWPGRYPLPLFRITPA